MIDITLYNNDVTENGKRIPVYQFKSIYKVNIIAGDSGIGKTHMYTCIDNALASRDDWLITSNKKIELVDNFTDIQGKLLNTKDTIFIADEEEVNTLLKNDISYLISKSDNYFIFIARQADVFIDTNVRALFLINNTGKIYNGIELYNILPYINIQSINTNVNYSDFELLITEDTASGRKFLNAMLDKLKPFGETGGRSVIPLNVVDALEQTDKKVLIAMDYDTSLLEMTKILINTEIDKSRIAFISMESFEEILCNSEFILRAFPEMKDEVFNYDKYITSSHKHTGRYFSDLLFKYVKVKSPLKQNGQRNATKFYEKGMANFENCFLNDCCNYKLTDCKLYVDKDKKKLMLCNKFEYLRPFSTAYDE